MWECLHIFVKLAPFCMMQASPLATSKWIPLPFDVLSVDAHQRASHRWSLVCVVENFLLASPGRYVHVADVLIAAINVLRP